MHILMYRCCAAASIPHLTSNKSNRCHFGDQLYMDQNGISDSTKCTFFKSKYSFALPYHKNIISETIAVEI